MLIVDNENITTAHHAASEIRTVSALLTKQVNYPKASTNPVKSMNASAQAWFGRKRFGFGYGPRSWQGWLATAIYVVLMIGTPRVISPRADHALFLGMMVLLTVIYLAIFVWKLDRTAT